VAQTVLAKLGRRLRTLRCDPIQGFRAYLKTLANYARCDLLADHRRPGATATGGGEGLRQLDATAAPDDPARRLGEEFDLERLDEAMGRVQRRVEAATWEAFHLTAREGLTGAEAARRLGLTAAGVFKARSRVQQMLRVELAEHQP
jgi:DNA-directed RNA polymerase specialized sigma24 family protein